MYFKTIKRMLNAIEMESEGHENNFVPVCGDCD